VASYASDDLTLDQLRAVYLANTALRELQPDLLDELNVSAIHMLLEKVC